MPLLARSERAWTVWEREQGWQVGWLGAVGGPGEAEVEAEG